MQKKQKIGFLYILPALVLFFIFVAYPIIFNFYIGFHKWSGLGEPVWVGLKNYKKVFSEPVFNTVLKNFVIITGLFVILDSVFGMIIAAFLNLKLKMSKAARLLIYLPNILSSVVIGYAFQMLLETNNGIVNVWLRKLGLQNLAQQWLINPKLVIYVILAILLWQGVGFAMVLYTSGISGIPQELYEAAKIDGAGETKQFFYITVPLLRGTTYTLVILNVITYIKLFDLVQVLTNGGPGTTTYTFTIYVYNKAFTLYDMGGASAVATIMLVISLILTAIQLKMYDKGKE